MTETFDIDWNTFAARGMADIPESLKKSLLQVTTYSTPSPLKRLVLTQACKVYCSLGESQREGISSLVKRNVDPAEMRQKLEQSMDNQVLQVAQLLKSRPNLLAQPTLLLSHDVDYKKCYEFIPRMAEIEAKNGIRASYHFLPRAGYRIEKSLIKDLVAMGHEVGVHGLDYHLRLGFYSQSKIASVLRTSRRILEDLADGPVLGYRNHGLRQTPALVRALMQEKFTYNSGVYPRGTNSGFEMYFSWPFRYKEGGLVEIPVLWPLDTEAFRVLQLSTESALSEFIKRARIAVESLGVVCFDLHPSIMSQRIDFLTQLIQELRAMQLTSKTLGNYATEFQKL